jgi:hypothetical protein
MIARRRDSQAVIKGPQTAKLKRRGLSCADLAGEHVAIGVEDSNRNVSNEFSRWSLAAVLLVQCMEAMDSKAFRLEDA